MIRFLARALGVAAVLGLAAACADAGDPLAAEIDGSIRGTITDDTGAAVANAAVALTAPGKAARATNSGTDGVYTFADVPAGTYSVKVTPPPGYAVGTEGTVSVTVASGAEANAGAVVLNRTGSVQGTIADEAGVAVANATIQLTAPGRELRTTSSGSDGVYIFANVPAGTYALTVVPPFGFSLSTDGVVSVTVASGAQASAAAIVLHRLSADELFAATVEQQLRTASENGQFSGAVLVMHNGTTLFEGAYGLADREKEVPNTLLTQFRVGSMYKMLTAVAALQLVQAGKLSVNATLGTYLPDYPNAALASKVTIHHLLTHTGGTGDIFGPQFIENRLQLRDIDDYLKLYGTRALLFEPGTLHAYSNYGFVLLGAVIERVSGMRYDDYVAAHVLGPAGMTATGTAPEDSLVPLRSAGYTYQFVPGQLVSNAPTLPYRGTPAGGGYSTVADMARLAVALRGHQLLDPPHTAQLIDGKVPVGNGWMYAYGFIDRTVAGRRIVGHGGGAAGMNGELAFEPNSGYVVVVLSNFDPPSASQIANFILARLPER